MNEVLPLRSGDGVTSERHFCGSNAHMTSRPPLMPCLMGNGSVAISLGLVHTARSCWSSTWVSYLIQNCRMGIFFCCLHAWIIITKEECLKCFECVAVVVSSLARMVCFFFSIFANMIVFARWVVCLLDEYSLSVHKRTVLDNTIVCLR